VVNLHESGLKVTKFKSLLEQTQKEEEEAAALAKAQEQQQQQPLAVGAAAPGEAQATGGKGGWRRWVFFWRKSA
jgi:hypothetical protein